MRICTITTQCADLYRHRAPSVSRWIGKCRSNR
jgi:hypothetical protein